MAVCAAVIGKENSPKFVTCKEPENELMFHYKVHTSLDIIEEKLGTVGKNTDLRELYLGLLYATEEHKVYGYVTNTRIKLVIVVDAQAPLRDNEIKTMFRKLHQAYTDAVCNPFYIPGEVIESPKFSAVASTILSGK